MNQAQTEKGPRKISLFTNMVLGWAIGNLAVLSEAIYHNPKPYVEIAEYIRKDPQALVEIGRYFMTALKIMLN